MKFAILSMGLVINLFNASPTLANQSATVSFGPLVVPSPQVAACMIQKKRNLGISNRNYNKDCGSILAAHGH